MKAVILAAGRGRRLGAEIPKCLHEVGGTSLLGRMLEAIHGLVDEVVLVVGFEATSLIGECEALIASGAEPRPRLRALINEEWSSGSILSLQCACEVFGEGPLVLMDADVLFPRALFERLVQSEAENCFLLDPRSEASGEEMMLVARDGRVKRIARSTQPEAEDVVGEGVGFLKLGLAAQASLKDTIDRLVEGGARGDYEDAIDAALSSFEARYVEVGDLPWTEIDFAEDLELARTQILPRIAAL